MGGRRKYPATDRPVFVDRFGRRRKLVLAVWTLTGVMLVGWLAVIGIGAGLLVPA
ncbi:hypothetical protein Val02_81570 [Virgisporangium aliadipatigenens]|uniref:Uncharacterized protein n=1 Tax=Virgisporangium aliadipatigenens TaxID=741659 RepID=A0A8J3YTJ2_9ACTN|nr:hypothetical protein [Virgisporangium aliadipatigenens]GIJ51271.1 hypothetical protein Val02_81570 [Virgisporangium aliadipatigenens]